MVFFKKEMERAVMVHPQFLGRNLLQHVKDQLVSEVQGMSLDDAGFIIAVLRVNDEMQRGVIDHLTGFVKYRVAYSALMFRPFKNEVLDATVKAVSDVRRLGSANVVCRQGVRDMRASTHAAATTSFTHRRSGSSPRLGRCPSSSAAS